MKDNTIHQLQYKTFSSSGHCEDISSVPAAAEKEQAVCAEHQEAEYQLLQRCVRESEGTAENLENRLFSC